VCRQIHVLADWDATVLERAFKDAMISSEIAASKIADRGFDSARMRLPLATNKGRATKGGSPFSG
jgi:hypothetical protein